MPSTLSREILSLGEAWSEEQNRLNDQHFRELWQLEVAEARLTEQHTNIAARIATSAAATAQQQRRPLQEQHQEQQRRPLQRQLSGWSPTILETESEIE